MATCSFSSPTSVKHHSAPSPIYNCTTANTKSRALCFTASHKFNLHRSFLFKRNPWSGRCYAAGPPSEPPSEKSLAPISGVRSAFTKFQDTLQIFFAVLFWMSLFFWSSSWNGGDSSKQNKGSRFRK
ncbi:Unknown protein [Striga hermonthica]|uniref:Uncharacterized protein n=1 Tax=Striga hermonthica TaxID=68872 RepID=A0A9N7NCA6_STRHE|nr:Unknown protein [Striga hermonthica]